MKKFFVIAAAALVALAACTKAEVNDFEYQKSREINFVTVANKATKAPLTGTVYPSTAPSFGVFAYYLASGSWSTSAANSTAAVYMNDVKVSFSDSLDIWAPSSTYYWPLEGSLTFIAYSPDTCATAAFANDGTLTLTNFTVKTDVPNQIDLMYSSLNADKTANESYYVDTTTSKNSQTAPGSNKGVNIKFKHALAQVIFKAKTADAVYDAGMSFKIDTIVVNAASTATSMTVTNPTDAQLAADITTWNSPGSNLNFAASIEDFPAASNEYLTKTLSDPIGDPLLMIPVTSFEGTDPSVTVKYTLYRTNDGLSMGSKEVTVKFDDIDDVITAWQAGKKYVYNLTIDLQKIYFNPSVVDWTDGGTQDVDIPDDATTI